MVDVRIGFTYASAFLQNSTDQKIQEKYTLFVGQLYWKGVLRNYRRKIP